MAEAEAEVGVELDSAKRARRRALRTSQMQREWIVEEFALARGRKSADMFAYRIIE